jgi:hypothetical protein
MLRVSFSANQLLYKLRDLVLADPTRVREVRLEGLMEVFL